MSNQSVNVRQSFVPRPGYYFMDPDYSQIEFKLSAAIAGEKHLIKGFEDGNDYYTMIYDSMYGTNFKTKDKIPSSQRKLGKEISLGQNYGQEANGLARKLKVPLEKGKEYMDKYWNGLPATRLAKEEALQFALKYGYVNTWFGRRRPLPDLYSPIRGIKSKAVRSVWNTIIQGTAADVLKIAMIRASRVLASYDAHLLLTVQDELLIEVNEKEPFWEVNKLVIEAMEFPLPGLPINMPDRYPNGYVIKVGPGYCYDWGHVEDSAEEFLAKNPQINATPVRPNLVYSFLAEPQPITIQSIAPRVKNVAEADAKKAVPLMGEHPILEVVNQARKNKGLDPIPRENQQVTPAPLPEAVVVTEGVDQNKTAVEVVNSVVASLPPPPPLPTPIQPVHAVLVEPPSAVQPSFATPTPQKNNDFTYPCMILHVKKDLVQKDLELMKAVLAKFPGNYWLYVEYRGQVLKMGEKYKCDPTSQMQSYMKRALGPESEIEVFDEKGKQSRGRVQFD